MNKSAFKKLVLEKAKKRQQEIIDNYRERISELKNSNVLMNEEQYDHDQQSMDESGIEKADALADQLNFAVDEMDYLNKMLVTKKPHVRVESGAIVKADKMTFFPSVSLEKFSVNGDQLFGISLDSPVFKAMRGKKKGELFSYNGEQYKILDVY